MSKPPDLPNVDPSLFAKPDATDFKSVATSTHPPRILLLYGSLRERSFSRLLTFEAQRLLPRHAFSIRRACRCRTDIRSIIQRFRSCVTSPPGPKAWYGLHRSVTAP